MTIFFVPLALLQGLSDSGSSINQAFTDGLHGTFQDLQTVGLRGRQPDSNHHDGGCPACEVKGGSSRKGKRMPLNE